MTWVLFIIAIACLIGAVLIFLRKRQAAPAAAVLVLVGIGAFAGSFVRVVPAGHVAVASFFGAVQEGVYGEGMHMVNPLYGLQDFSIRRTMFDFSGTKRRGAAGPQIVAVSSDSLRLTVDVGFPMRLNGPSAWKVYQRIGNQWAVAQQLVVPAARAAVRDAVAQSSWRDATSASRAKLAQSIEERFRALVQNDLVAAGFDAKEAETTFTIQPVQLRKVLPPTKVLNAVSEKIASEEDLQRQRTLTQIAEEEARRRKNEGVGVKNLFTELPRGFTASQIRDVLAAMADKTRAEALMKAVETGQVQVVVMNGSSQPALSVPGGKTVRR